MCALPFHVRRRQVSPAASMVEPIVVATHEQRPLTRRGGRALDFLLRPSSQASNASQRQRHRQQRDGGVPTQTRQVVAIVSSEEEEKPAVAPFGTDLAAWLEWKGAEAESAQLLASKVAGRQQQLAAADPEEEAKRARARLAHELRVVKDRRSGVLHKPWAFFTPYLMALRLCIGLPIGTGYSRVFPWLIVGDFATASDENTLLTLRVSHLWNCAAELPELRDDRFVTDKIYLKPRIEQSISSHWITVFNSLDRVQTCRGCAFLYCNNGGDRSPAVVVAYLMYRWRILLADAFTFVLLSRPSAMPNRQYMMALAQYEVRSPRWSKRCCTCF